MRWGCQRNFKQIRKRRTLIKLRESIINAICVPKEYLNSSNVDHSQEYFKEIGHLRTSVIGYLDTMTKRLPRKLKKKYRKTYKGICK